MVYKLKIENNFHKKQTQLTLCIFIYTLFYYIFPFRFHTKSVSGNLTGVALEKK